MSGLLCIPTKFGQKSVGTHRAEHDYITEHPMDEVLQPQYFRTVVHNLQINDFIWVQTPHEIAELIVMGPADRMNPRRVDRAPGIVETKVLRRIELADAADDAGKPKAPPVFKAVSKGFGRFNVEDQYGNVADKGLTKEDAKALAANRNQHAEPEQEAA